MMLMLQMIQSLVLMLAPANAVVSASFLHSRNASQMKRQPHSGCSAGLQHIKDKLRHDGGFPIPEDGLHTPAVEGGADSGLFAYLGQLSYDELSRVHQDSSSGTICETGFNYGTSSYAFLCSTQAQVFAWDLGAHAYVQHAQELVSAEFPGRHHLTLGDSTTTLPRAAAASNDEPLLGRKCDFVYVDGGHSQDVASSDLENFAKIAAPGALIVVDDCYHGGTGHIQGVTTAFDLAVQAGKILPEQTLSQTFTQRRSLCVGRLPKARAFLQHGK
mmetsp:Transcript_2288/g.4236  ORF Transcript_2288/g.4236 Transcript_2288/m.4236 type:complete len:273 (+) Transcript_2288:52-870(+)